MVQPGGEVLFGDYAELTDDLKDGFIQQVSLILSDNSRMVGNSAVRERGEITTIDRAVYSPCNLCKDDPHGAAAVADPRRAGDQRRGGEGHHLPRRLHRPVRRAAVLHAVFLDARPLGRPAPGLPVPDLRRDLRCRAVLRAAVLFRHLAGPGRHGRHHGHARCRHAVQRRVPQALRQGPRHPQRQHQPERLRQDPERQFRLQRQQPELPLATGALALLRLRPLRLRPELAVRDRYPAHLGPDLSRQSSASPAPTCCRAAPMPRASTD